MIRQANQVFACLMPYNRGEASKQDDNKGKYHMRNQLARPSMLIALTLLLAGIVVQVTDFFEFFGHNSFVPLLLGLGIIVIGVFVVLFMQRYNKEQ